MGKATERFLQLLRYKCSDGYQAEKTEDVHWKPQDEKRPKLTGTAADFS